MAFGCLGVLIKCHLNNKENLNAKKGIKYCLQLYKQTEPQLDDVGTALCHKFLDLHYLTKISLISKGAHGPISNIKLIRTDILYFDLSQKAKKQYRLSDSLTFSV